MLMRKRLGHLGLTLGLMSGFSVAFAQPAAPPVADPAAPQEASPIQPVEMPEAARTSIEKIRESLTQTLKLLEQARAERDVIKLNCVNEKLTQIKGLLRISEQADVSLQESLARKDLEAANHVFTKLTIAGQKVASLASEAEACIGELAMDIGEPKVTTEIDEGDFNLDEDNPIPDPPFVPGGEIPPPASPVT